MTSVQTLQDSLPVQGQGRVGTAWWGMVCAVATEATLFAYLIFTYAYLGSQNVRWPTGSVPSLKLALPATVLLVASSFVLEWAKKAARADRLGAARGATVLTLLLGGGFVALELKEWADKPWGLGQDSYSSIYFLLTGTHLAHVVLGLAGITLLLVWSLAGRLRQEHDQHRALIALYWHFVDVVWLCVFATVYLSPRLT